MVNRASESCGNNPGSLPEGARYHESDNVTISGHKMILLLKFACNTDLGLKKLVARLKNDNFLLQTETSQKCKLC